MGQQTTSLLIAPLQKKQRNTSVRKNSFATAHCTNLPLPPNTRSQPEGKGKIVQSPTLYFAESIKEHVFRYI
jgi:hypothetical protein